MLALWVALGALVLLVLVLGAVATWRLFHGRAAAGLPEPEILTLDPGPATVSEQAALIADRLVGLDAGLRDARRQLQDGRPAAQEPERRRELDRVYGDGSRTPSDEDWAAVAGLGDRLAADLAEARGAMRTARTVWAGLDRQPLGRRVDQARGVLEEADALVVRLLAAQSAALRYSVLRVRWMLANGDLAATSVAEQALAAVRASESLADLRREVDDLLANLDLTTRADRMLHPRSSRLREGTASVRAAVAERPWVSVSDLAASAEQQKV